LLTAYDGHAIPSTFLCSELEHKPILLCLYSFAVTVWLPSFGSYRKEMTLLVRWFYRPSAKLWLLAIFLPVQLSSWPSTLLPGASR